MNRVQAVVFDMDGVLVESEDLWLRARTEFAASIGRVWTAEDQVATMGCNTAAWARIMVQRLASGSPRALGEHVLRATGLDDILTVTLYGDEVEHGKPAPDVYLRVLERLGVHPEDAVGVEDSGNGIRSLHAAGMGIIAAPSPGYALSAEMLALAGAHIHSLTEFSMALVESAGAHRPGQHG